MRLNAEAQTRLSEITGMKALDATLAHTLWVEALRRDEAILVPLFGKVLRVAATALFARALALLLGSGVTVLDSLKTMEQLGNNIFLNSVISKARQRVFEAQHTRIGEQQRAGE